MRNFWEHLYRRTAERCSVIKRKRWNVLLSIFMFSCAQSNSYRMLNLKSVKITDMNSTPIWISYHFWTCKHWDKPDQKAIWLFLSFIWVNFHIGLHIKAAFKIVFILQGDYPVFVAFLFLIPVFVTYSFYFHERLILSKTVVEEDKKNIWEFKLLTLNSLSHTILFEGY